LAVSKVRAASFSAVVTRLCQGHWSFEFAEKHGGVLRDSVTLAVTTLMSTRIDEYYNELQRREGIEPVELVAEWTPRDTDAISAVFRAAVGASRITEKVIPIRASSTNQSIGNQVADFFVPIMNEHLQDYRIDACPGGGYPDKILVEIASGRTFPFELKATSTWNIADSNRRVLTSSSRKLRQRFPGAVNHVLATVVYATGTDVTQVRSLRLDFIESGTLVNIRLEASVSHRLLAEATHRSTTIP
jgi:hypothetical protein